MKRNERYARKGQASNDVHHHDGAPFPGARALVVKPRAACCLLSCGITRLYELLKAGELESFLDGNSRKITTASIEAYIARRLEGSKGAAA